MENLMDLVSRDVWIEWLVIGAAVFWFLWKNWPEFSKRVKQIGKTEILENRMNVLEKELKDIHMEIGTNYEDFVRFMDEVKYHKEVLDSSMEEREIIMRSLLGVLKGLQEIGANGPSKDAQREIEMYLNRQAHEIRGRKEPGER